MPSEHTRPVRVFSQDESRVGVLTVRRRRLTACGVQPVGLIQHTFTWFSIYGAVAPTTGERFFLLCVDALAQAFPDSVNILLVDNSGAQVAQRMRWPAHGRSMWLPPYGPELNPIERVRRDVKDDLAWQPCLDLEAQPVSVGNLWQADDAPTLHALTG